MTHITGRTDTRDRDTADRLPFYAFLLASAVSLVGNNMTMVAVPWFVLVTTGSATKTGLVGFFMALPSVVAGFFGGTLVDRLGHRRMSIIADLASGATVALIPLLHITVGLRYWQLLLIVFASALLDVPATLPATPSCPTSAPPRACHSNVPTLRNKPSTAEGCWWVRLLPESSSRGWGRVTSCG